MKSQHHFLLPTILGLVIQFSCSGQNGSKPENPFSYKPIVELMDTLIHFSNLEPNADSSLIVVKGVTRNDTIFVLASLIESDHLYLVLFSQEADTSVRFSHYRSYDVLVFGDLSEYYFPSISNPSTAQSYAAAYDRARTISAEQEAGESDWIPLFYHPLVLVYYILNDEVVHRYSFEDYWILK